jgi:adenine-specific DNA-methyltransferase
LPPVIVGDCVEQMALLDAGSVALVVADPPYHRVLAEGWDRQWKDEAAYLLWLGGVLDGILRVLRPNGSLYLFCWPGLAWRVEGLVRERFHMLNRITWQKDGAWAHGSDKEGMRRFGNAHEVVLFAERWEASDAWTQKADGVRGPVFEPLRAYLDGERQRAGVPKPECDGALGFTDKGGGMASRHYFAASQWCLPTAEHYQRLRVLFNRQGGDYLRREYEDLRREYEDLRREYETLRRPFTVTPQDQYTDVWAFPVVRPYPGKHPAEKPLALIEHVVRASSRPGDLVLDPFCGSGVTGEACANLGRDRLLIDKDERWVERTRRRLNPAQQPLI